MKTCFDSTVLANYYMDNVSTKFLEEVLHMTAREFIAKYEAFAITGIAGNTTSIGVANSNNRKTLLKMNIRNIFRAQLRKSPQALSLHLFA